MTNVATKKKAVAQRMIQRTYYDRNLKKLVREMVPESKEHRSFARTLGKQVSRAMKHEPSSHEKSSYQRRVGRSYND